VHLLSWYQVGCDEEVGGRPAAGERGRLDPRESGALVRDRRWGEVDLEPSQHPLFPRAVQVLDYYHCSEHVHKVGALQFTEDAVQEREWVEAMMARLFWGM